MLKPWKIACLALIASVALLMVSAHELTAEGDSQPAENQPQPEEENPTEYRGTEPGNGELATLSEHRVIAAYTETKYRVCRGRTARCPKRCGHSGEFAHFQVKDYLHYTKDEMRGGDGKATNYMVHITDFNRRPIGDDTRNKLVASLEPGDLVVIEWKHLYGEVREGLTAPVRPLLLLKKITAKEADELRKQAEAKESE